MRLWRPVVAGVVSALLILAVWWRPEAPTPAYGEFVRTACSSLATSNLTNGVLCYDTTAGTLMAFNATTGLFASITSANLSSFGATGNGTTDDTAAIRSALTSRVPVVVCPPGVYRITGTLTISNAVRFVGAGPAPGGNTTALNNDSGQCILEHRFSGDFISITGVSGNVLAGIGPSVENMILRQATGSGTNAGGNAIAVTKASDTFGPSWTHLRNVTIEVASGADDWTNGISLDGSAAATGPSSGGGLRDTYIENVRINAGNFSTAGILATSVGNLWVLNSTLNGNHGFLTITGPSAPKASANVNVIGTGGLAIFLDQVVSGGIIGGVWSQYTDTVNTSGVASMLTNLTTDATYTSTNSSLYVGKVGTTGGPAFWASASGLNFRTQYGPSWSGVTNPIMGTIDNVALRIVTNNQASMYIGPTGSILIDRGLGTLVDKGASTLNVASATFINNLPVLRSTASSINLMSVRSISATQTQGNNLRGTCTFSAASTCAVSFSSNEPDASYFVALGGNAAAAANVMPYGVTTKTVSGFTITATVSNSNSVDWILIH